MTGSDTEPPIESKVSRLRKLLKLTLVVEFIFFAWAWVSVAIFACWAVGALWFMSYLPKPVCILLAISFAIASLVAIVKLQRKRMALASIVGGIIVVFLMWLFIRPQQDRNWDLDLAELPHVAIDEDENVTLKNFRHCKYKTDTDYVVAYEQRTFQMSQIESVWYVVQRFSALDAMAHTFLSFGVRTEQGMDYLAVSVEIRREQGEEFSPLRGIFKNYEIMYVVGDERDLIGVRTNIRENDRICMYKTNATALQAQQMFRSIARRIQKLNRQPEFYHTLFNSCTNNIVAHTNSFSLVKVNPFDLNVVLPGYSDEVAFNRGLIGSADESFEELRVKSRIDQLARSNGINAGFSEAIRQRE